jgi:predicted nucleotidyltransferase
MDKTTDSRIRAYINAVAQEYKLVQVYLFGSFASGKENQDSDIDLALVIEGLTNVEKFDTQISLMLLAAKFDTRIEPHPYSLEDFSDNPFALEIQRTGKAIKPEPSKTS